MYERQREREIVCVSVSDCSCLAANVSVVLDIQLNIKKIAMSPYYSAFHRNLDLIIAACFLTINDNTSLHDPKVDGIIFHLP